MDNLHIILQLDNEIRELRRERKLLWIMVIIEMLPLLYIFYFK